MIDLNVLGSGGVLALTKTHSTTLPDVSVGHVLGQTIFALIIIVGGVWIIGKLYAKKRSGQSLRRAPQSPDGLRILSRQTLGKDQQLAVVMWGDRKILIGISGSNISFFNDGMVDDASIASAIATPTPASMPVPMPTTDAMPFSVGDPFQNTNTMNSFLGFNQPTPPPTKSLIERLRDVTQRN